MSNNAHPFDIQEFIKYNKKLVKKYLKKNTDKLVVPDIFVDSKKAFYNSNKNILDARYEKPEYTELQKLEYIKCARDCRYFTEKYIKIISIDAGVIPFKMYDFQGELLDKFQNNRFVISLQSRQTGKTTTVSSYILWFNTFHPTKTTAILANKAAQAREILARVQMSHENLPYFLKQGVTSYNKGSMSFKNLSGIFCATSTSSSIRGTSISLLYIDECAFLRNDMEFYESTYPTISSGKESQVIVTSTPNGARGLFYKLWTESEAGINRFVGHKVTWDKVPGRDQAWKEEQIAQTSQEQFDQEHGCCFRGSTNSLIASHVLESLPEHKVLYQVGDVKVYEDPVEDHNYFIAVDTSRGVGGDFSAFIVFDVTELPYKVCATYRNNRISPLVYPSVIYNAAITYNEAAVLVEINDIGEQVTSILHHDYEYEELLHVVPEKNKQILGFGANQRPGVRTTVPVKAIGCSNIKTLIENHKVELRDKDVIGEFGTFIPKGKSYEADSGANDDFAMCCVLFAWATSQTYFKEMTDKDTRRSVMEEQERRAFDNVMPFGVIDNGIDPEFDGVESLDDKDEDVWVRSSNDRSWPKF